MVSPLWKACADGDVAAVEALLKDATSVDIEVKDHTGVTPLIQAVKGGHVDIAKALIAHGADPTNASAQGRPETYTQDPYILQILATARGEPAVPYPDPSQYYAYPHYPPYPMYPDPSAQYYPPPPPPPPPQPSQDGEHAANLPPPEVARNIPCRYYPACRYGSFCIFAHPSVPYFSGPLPPPAHYGPPPANPPPPPPQHFDPNMGAPAPYPYYPSPQFNPPMSPGHMRTHSDVISPPPFSPSHPPMQMQYPPGPPPPVPPMSPLSGYPAPPPPPNAYPRRGSVASAASYPSPVSLDPTHGAPVPKLSDVQGSARPRRSSAAVREGRPPYSGRKPPCLFFPSGRCRNGDDCRFPHVVPDGGSPNPPQRGNYPLRSRTGSGYFGSRDNGAGAGYGTIEEKLSGLSIRDSPATVNDTSKPVQVNGKRAPAHTLPKPQRVPSADDFPVLRGVTPPQQHHQPQANGHANGHAWAQAVNGTGPTAAQLLREKDAAASRDPSPRPGKDSKAAPMPAPNGTSVPENLASTNKPTEVPVSA